jgi:hypothetical protein
MNIEFKSDLPKLQAMLDELSENVAPAATAAALNRTATHVAKVARKGVTQDTGIPQKHFKKRIAIPRGKKANARRLVTVLWAGLWEIPVANLSPKPRALKSGVAKYKTLPGEPIDPQAFIAKGSKGVSAFARKGSARLPIKQKTINIGNVIRRKIFMALGSSAKEFFKKTYYSQMEGRVINAMKRKGMTVK